MKCISNKTSDLLRDDLKNIIGIQGKVRNTKNKCSIPFKECEFELKYTNGLDPYSGLLKMFESDGLVERNGAWYSIPETGKKFQSKDFVSMLQDPTEIGVKNLAKYLEE